MRNNNMRSGNPPAPRQSRPPARGVAAKSNFLSVGEDIQLRICVDRSIVDVFVNDRQAMVKQHAYAPGDVGVCLFSEGGKMKVRELKAWTMAASNPW